MKRITRRLAVIAAAQFGLLVGAAALAPAAQAAEKVTLLLNWVPQGDHSPYYYARKMGWYAEEGIDLTIEGGRGSAATIPRVAAGQVQVGIADMANILEGRSKNIDAVGVMALYANTAFGLYWKKGGGIASPKDIAGKKIGAPAGDAVRPIWPVIAKAIGIPADSVTWVNIAPEAKVASLQAGIIDVSPHLYSVHDVYEKSFGKDLGYVSLRELGVNPYGLSIFTSGAYMKSNPETLKKFLKVSQKAIRACFENPKPCTDVLASETSQNAEDVLANWKRVETLIADDVGRKVAIGAYDPARVQADVSMIETLFNVKLGSGPFFTNDYLDMSIKLP